MTAQRQIKLYKYKYKSIYMPSLESRGPIELLIGKSVESQICQINLYAELNLRSIRVDPTQLVRQSIVRVRFEVALIH